MIPLEKWMATLAVIILSQFRTKYVPMILTDLFIICKVCPKELLPLFWNQALLQELLIYILKIFLLLLDGFLVEAVSHYGDTSTSYSRSCLSLSTTVNISDCYSICCFLIKQPDKRQLRGKRLIFAHDYRSAAMGNFKVAVTWSH